MSHMSIKDTDRHDVSILTRALDHLKRLNRKLPLRHTHTHTHALTHIKHKERHFS